MSISPLLRLGEPCYYSRQKYSQPRIETGKLNLQTKEIRFEYQVGSVRSPAVHVHLTDVARLDFTRFNKPAPQAWGGYHDAGDWNPRRVTHMQVTMAMLEMYEQFPDHFGNLKWIGNKQTGLPDILEEAVWEFSCFHRLQYENGGVGYGIEIGDPVKGEVSWLNSFVSYVLAPDYDASWYYAAVGARLS